MNHSFEDSIRLPNARARLKRLATSIGCAAAVFVLCTGFVSSPTEFLSDSTRFAVFEKGWFKVDYPFESALPRFDIIMRAPGLPSYYQQSYRRNQRSEVYELRFAALRTKGAYVVQKSAAEGEGDRHTVYELLQFGAKGLRIIEVDCFSFENWKSLVAQGVFIMTRGSGCDIRDQATLFKMYDAIAALAPDAQRGYGHVTDFRSTTMDEADRAIGAYTAWRKPKEIPGDEAKRKYDAYRERQSQRDYCRLTKQDNCILY